MNLGQQHEKTNFLTFSIVMVFVFLFCNIEIDAQQWPQFRGPARDGKSAETGLLSEWPEGGPKLIWTANDSGKGYSSVSVVDGRLFTMGDIDDDQYVFALDAGSGAPLWKRRVGNANQGPYSGSRSTPTFNDDKLYCLTTDAELLCLNSKDGGIIWRRDLVKHVDAVLMQAMGKIDWRFSESPLVDGEQVVVTPGTKSAAMIAFNKNTGEELWRTELPELGEKGRDGAGYSSAVISEAGHVRQYVQLIGRGMIGVEASSGKFLWGYNQIANDVANISSPVAIGNKVFASTGYQTGSALVEINQTKMGAHTASEVYFLNSRIFQNHHGGFIIHNGYVYGGHGHKLGLPICIRLRDGKVMWGPIRTKGMSSAAVSYADGHLYFRYQNGLMVLVEATQDGYREKGSFVIPNVNAASWSHPVIANGCLFLKEQDQIHCYDISSKRTSTPIAASGNTHSFHWRALALP